MFTRIFDRLVGKVDCCPWQSSAYGARQDSMMKKAAQPRFLYSPAERRRRDSTKWTMVQGVLAPVQFVVFLTSLTLVLHYLYTGKGLEAASASVLVKTFFLYLIMITGAIWEHKVFGKYLFARAFFWEDVFSMLVLALHSLYVAVLFTNAVPARMQMFIALAAYASYVINASQFVLKLRMARLEQIVSPVSGEAA
jgi:3-vinyl bacteriochlorophyllide hydratase